jgi:Mrp family chromosome partitioning ATPase
MTEINRHREPVRYELVADSDEMGSAESTLASIHRHLRGRYHVAVATSLAFAGLVSVVAWHATKPNYESSGVVRVDPVHATTMHDPDGLPNSSLMAAYVAEQAMILRGRSVLETAAADPMLRATGWPSGDEGIAALEGSMTVEEPRGQNIVTLRLRNNEPARARAAVDAVLRAYQTEAGGPSARERRIRLDSLERRKVELLQHIEGLETSLLEASKGTGVELIERSHINKVEELIAIESQLHDLQSRRDAVSSGEIVPTLDPQASAPADASGAALLTRLTRQQDEIIARIDALNSRYSPRHPIIRDLEAELETVRIRISGLTGLGLGNGTGIDFTAGRLPDGTGIDFGHADETGDEQAMLAATGGLSALDRIDSLIAAANDRRERLRTEIADLSRRRASINTLRDRVDSAQLRLTDLDRRIEVIEASDSADATGVNIATWGDLPVAPIRDRRSQLAIAGGLAGAGFGVLLVLGVSALNPRIRYADDMASVAGAPAIAAILPDMSSGSPHADARSTRGIHQLRSIIELDTVTPEQNVVVVTGCARGEGRTSTALALATGLARSGRRTLVVDADLHGLKLSRELMLDGEPGLVEALGVNPGDARVHETAEPGLWALPVGIRGVIGEEVLSRPRLQWLLNTLRTRFDAIVVDTGPMLSSAEGPTLAGVADRTILIVERGIRASAVSAALDRLRQVSARCVGVVLNRADEADFRHLELGSETVVTRRGTIVETRPSAVSPAGRSSALAALGGRPAGTVIRETTTTGRTAA